MTNRHPNIEPMHPGELLREDVLPALGIGKGKMADLLHTSRQTLYEILAENRSVTPVMAVKLGKLCGNGPDLWLNLQTAYDLWRAERQVDTSKIPTLEAKAA